MNTFNIILTILASLLLPVHTQAATLKDTTEIQPLQNKTDSLLVPLPSIEYEVRTLTDEYLDSLDIQKKLLINDYSMIGLSYGVGFNSMNFNPVKKNSFFFIPNQIGVIYTKYCKMFGYMPYFGVQTGLFYGQYGYRFKANSEGNITDIDGATGALFDYIEIPAMAHFHIDFWKMKFMANLGLYGGYRLKVHRTGEQVPAQFTNHFYSYENRWDFGFKGGLGIGFIFDPCELHINAIFSHSLSSIYEPDYADKYYYKFAYPMNLTISVGLHFQLGKRTGKTRAQIRKEAYDRVYNPPAEEENKK